MLVSVQTVFTVENRVNGTFTKGEVSLVQITVQGSFSCKACIYTVIIKGAFYVQGHVYIIF